MSRKKVLFVCIHNSARSQMAEAFLNQVCPDEFEAISAGLEPTRINPLVVEVMKEVGIDLASKKTQDVWTLAKRGSLFAFVISVCHEAAERCPIFPASASGGRGASRIQRRSKVRTKRSWRRRAPSATRSAPRWRASATRSVSRERDGRQSSETRRGLASRRRLPNCLSAGDRESRAGCTRRTQASRNPCVGRRSYAGTGSATE